MPRPSFFLVGLALAGLALFGVPKLWRAWGAWGEDAGETPGSRAVIVLLVDDHDTIERVRRRVRRSRVVAQSEEAIALEGGRVVAVSHDAAARVLGSAGWTDRSIEIYSAASMRGVRGRPSSSESRGDTSPYDRPAFSGLEALGLLDTLDGR